MKSKTVNNRGLWDAGALAAAAAVAVLATACGGGSAPATATTAAVNTQQTLAQCVRSLGVPNQVALWACQHLLPPYTHASVNAATWGPR